MKKKNSDRVNRNAKDSVFTDLFARPEYLLQLYQVFHPEDNVTTKESLTIVTLESLLLKERYNDLGFMAGDRLLILAEAQSTWSVNISVRFLLYIAETYKRYIEKNGLNLFSTKKVILPVPELYVIYTGKGDHPETIRLRRDIFGGAAGSVEIEARVIHSSRQGDILNQYIRFTHIFDEQIRQNGRTRKAIEETFRLCRSENILSEYLKNEEVADKMYTFVDYEKQLEFLKQEEREEGREEGEGLAARLMTILLARGLIKEAKMAAADRDYRHRLYREYELS